MRYSASRVIALPTSSERIPRRIHYCWLSDDPLPELNQRCVDSWHRFMPDYEIVRWDMKRAATFDARFLREAISVRAWAFATDYIRLQAIALEGGIYLDTDVEVFRSFDRFLSNRAFSAIEHWPEIKLISIDGAMLAPSSARTARRTRLLSVAFSPKSPLKILAFVMKSQSNI